MDDQDLDGETNGFNVASKLLAFGSRCRPASPSVAKKQNACLFPCFFPKFFLQGQECNGLGTTQRELCLDSSSATALGFISRACWWIGHCVLLCSSLLREPHLTTFKTGRRNDLSFLLLSLGICLFHITSAGSTDENFIKVNKALP